MSRTDPEMQAIKAVTPVTDVFRRTPKDEAECKQVASACNALKKLSPDARERVFDYARKRNGDSAPEFTETHTSVSIPER